MRPDPTHTRSKENRHRAGAVALVALLFAAALPLPAHAGIGETYDLLKGTAHATIWTGTNMTRNWTRTPHQVLITVYNDTYDGVYRFNPYHAGGNTTPLVSILVANLSQEGEYVLVPPCEGSPCASAREQLRTQAHLDETIDEDSESVFPWAALYMDVMPIPGVWRVLHGEEAIAGFVIDQIANQPNNGAQGAATSKVLPPPPGPPSLTLASTTSGGEDDVFAPFVTDCPDGSYPDMTNKPGWAKDTRATHGERSDLWAGYAIAGFDMTYWEFVEEPWFGPYVKCRQVYTYHRPLVGALALEVVGRTHVGDVELYQVHLKTDGFYEKSECYYRQSGYGCRVQQLWVVSPWIEIPHQPGKQVIFDGLAWAASEKGAGIQWTDVAHEALSFMMGQIHTVLGVFYDVATALYQVYGHKLACDLSRGCAKFLVASTEDRNYALKANVQLGDRTSNGVQTLDVKAGATFVWKDYVQYYVNSREAHTSPIFEASYRVNVDVAIPVCRGDDTLCQNY